MSSRLFAGRYGAVAIGLLAGEFTSAMQSLVVTTVMPKIATELHGLALYPFAYAALLGASVVSMTFAGPFADRFGTRRVLALGYALAMLGLIACMFSRTMPQFIGARAIEGFGGGLDYAVSLAAVAKVFPEEIRPKMFAWSSAMWVVPGLIGPALGALVANALGWRAVFALFMPFVVVSAALVLPALAGLTTARERFDAFGALRELWGSRRMTFVAFALLQGAFFGADAYVSLMLTTIRGMSLNAAGLCITLAVLGWSLGSALQPRALSRIGIRGIVVSAGVAGTAAALVMAAVDLGAPLPLAFAAWSLGGVGIGFAYPALTLAALESSGEGSEGATSSATLLAGVIGSSFGVLACGIPVTIAHHGPLALQPAIAMTYFIAACGALALALVARALPQRSMTAS